jgi:hypothetical protein
MAHGVFAQAVDTRAEESRHIRFKNDRIAEVMRFAIQRSPTFRGLVETIEASNAVVYVEEGVCRRAGVVACTSVVPTVGSRYLQIRIDPRQGQTVVAQHLAHEFQHAVEILGRAEVVDDAGVEGLYREIGHPGCADGQRCWETPAARTVEEMVHRELVSSAVAIARAYFGAWVLNVDKSQFTATESATEGRRFHRDQKHGLISVVSEVHEDRGTLTRQTFVFRPDGREYVVSDENGAKEHMTLTVIDPFTIEFVVRREGEVTATGVQRLSSDGRTLTIETCATDASRPRSLTVWEKID